MKDPYTMLTLMGYACNLNHDTSMFNAFYKKDLMPRAAKTVQWVKIRFLFKEAADFNAELASQLLAIHKDELAFVYAKDADKCLGNKDTTTKAYGLFTNSGIRV